MRRSFVFVVLFSVLLVFGLVGLSRPGDYFVDVNNGDDANDGSESSCWKTITHALASVSGSAANPAVIRVAAGTYVENVTMGSHVMLLGGYPPGGGERDPEANPTIIDGNAAGSVIWVESKENVTIDGFTITNGRHDVNGGGIYCKRSSPTLTDCKITGNSAGTWGAGLFMTDNCHCTVTRCFIADNTSDESAAGVVCHLESHPTFTDCVISGNTAAMYGGGLYCSYAGNPTLMNCIISENSAPRGGGAIHCGTEPYFVLANCLITKNTSNQHCGGIYMEGQGGSPTIMNCTFSGNDGNADGVGLSGAGAIWCYNWLNAPVIANCIFWGDSPYEFEEGLNYVTYSDVQGGYAGEGNIDDDPLFVSGYYLSQTAAGQASDSPCVDAGSDTSLNLGLDWLTTRTDKAPDVGTVDLGYHYALAGQPPVAFIDSIEPNPAVQGSGYVRFHGHGADSDGEVVAFEWSSDLQGHVIATSEDFWTDSSGLKVGVHTISFRVKDNDGLWSSPDTTTLTIQAGTASDFYVDVANGSDNNTGTATSPWKTISHAVSSVSGTASGPVTIHVAGGTYMENPELKSSVVTLLGGYPPGGGPREPETYETIIDGRGADAAVKIVEGSIVTVDGFTIQNGYAEAGGGFYINNSSAELVSCTIQDNRAGPSAACNGGGVCCTWGVLNVIECRFTDNTAGGSGGAISTYGNSPTLTGCLFLGNSAEVSGGAVQFQSSPAPSLNNCVMSNNKCKLSGGALFCYNGTPTLTNCLINSNESEIDGGGVYIKFSSPGCLTNCLIVANKAWRNGGGVYVTDDGASPMFLNCTVTDNEADSDKDGDGSGGSLYVVNSTCCPEVLNSVLWRNTPGEIDGNTTNLVITYSDVKGGWAGAGNIDADPDFTGGFYLSQITAGQDRNSPCVDAGQGSVWDYGLGETTTRIDGVRDADPIDMGYHYPAEGGSDNRAPVIVGEPSVTAVGIDTAIVEWTTDEPANSIVEYRTEQGEVQTATESRMSRAHTVRLSQLSPNTGYHFRVGSRDEAGNGPTFSDWSVFRTRMRADNVPPSVLTGPAASAVSSNTATIIWTTDEPSMGGLEYTGSARTSGSFTEQQYERVHMVTLEGLQPDSEYECTLMCMDTSGNIGERTDFRFATTQVPDTFPPKIVAGPEVIYVDTTVALIGFRADELCTASVEYGTSKEYGDSAAAPEGAVIHEIFLCGLTPGTPYHYRVNCTDALGNGPAVSSDFEFRALATADEAGLHFVAEPSVAYTTDTTAKVQWTTDKVSDTSLDVWERDGNAAETQQWHDGSAEREHEVFLNGLKPETTYNFLASSVDLAGNRVCSQSVGEFTTQSVPDSVPPELASIGLAYNAGNKVRIDWESSEPADSRILLWQKGTRKTTKGGWAASENNMEHTGWLTGLESGMEYDFQVGSADASGNICWTDGGSFTASDEEDSSAPNITSGPSAESRRSEDSIAIVWVTDEIADTVVEYWQQGETEGNRYRWASYDHRTNHRVELPGLSPGSYDFQVTSTDPAGNSVVSGASTFAVSGSASDPTLSNPHVTPSSGSLSTEFTYSVSYKCPSGLAPLSATVVIGGLGSRDMQLAEGEPSDGLYEYSTTLSAGTHTFRFEFESGSGQTISSPQSGDYSGPRVFPIPELSISIYADKAQYQPGEEQSVWVDASNTGDPFDVDFYAFMSLPDGSLRFWPDLGPSPVAFPILPFPGGVTFNQYQIFGQALPTDLPPGVHGWQAAFCEHGTFDQLCEPASASFTVSEGSWQCAVELVLNDSRFAPQDSMVLKLLATNTGSAVEADLYARVVLPGGALLYLPSFSSSPTPIALSVPAGCSNEEFELLRINLPPGLPSGGYEWAATLCNRGGAEPVSNESRAGFGIFNATLSVSTNGSSYSAGDQLTAYLSVRNWGPDIDLDVYVALMLPDGMILYLPSLGLSLERFYALRPLPEAAEYANVPIFDTQLPSGLPSGDYRFLAAFFEADSMDLYGKYSEAAWALSD